MINSIHGTEKIAPGRADLREIVHSRRVLETDAAARGRNYDRNDVRGSKDSLNQEVVPGRYASSADDSRGLEIPHDIYGADGKLVNSYVPGRFANVCG